jgi:hypothetical protein
MVVSYTSSSDSFHADKPRLWSTGHFSSRGASVTYALHPDGKRFAVLKAPNEAAGVGTIDEAVWAARTGKRLGIASALEGFGREANAVWVSTVDGDAGARRGRSQS